MKLAVARRRASSSVRRACGPAILLVLAGMSIAGCGTGSYDALLKQRTAELQRMAPFTQLAGPVTLADTRVKIRVPALFKASYTQDSAHPQDGPKIDPRRLQPPFMGLPGFKLCFEAFETDLVQTKLPYYCYLAALPANLGANLVAQIPIALKQQFPDAQPAWEPAPVITPAGGEVQWKKLRVEGEMFFDVAAVGKPQNEFLKLPGIFELWLYDAPDYIVMVAWRIPASLEDKVHLLNLAPFTAGTIEIAPAPPEAPAAAPAQPPA